MPFLTYDPTQHQPGNVKPDKPHGWKKALVIAVVLLAVTPFVFFLIYIGMGR
jgi:hypothetical protein